MYKSLGFFLSKNEKKELFIESLVVMKFSNIMNNRFKALRDSSLCYEGEIT